MATQKSKSMLDSMMTMTPMAPHAMAVMVRPQAQMMEAMLKQQIEVLDFLRARCERDRAMVAKLTTATEGNEVMSLWTEFMQRMMADYTTETTKLATSVSEIAQQAVRTATDEAAAVAENLKPKV